MCVSLYRSAPLLSGGLYLVQDYVGLLKQSDSSLARSESSCFGLNSKAPRLFIRPPDQGRLFSGVAPNDVMEPLKFGRRSC